MNKTFDNMVLFIAQGGFSGRMPVAPGTAGTVVGVLLYLLVKDLPALWYSAVFAIVTLIGTWAAGAADRVLGTKDMDSALQKVKQFTLAGVAEKITCPFLILWGTQDKLTPLSVADQLYNAVGSKDKMLKVFDEEEGAAEHCQVDNRQMGTDYICDWLSKRLL